MSRLARISLAVAVLLLAAGTACGSGRQEAPAALAAPTPTAEAAAPTPSSRAVEATATPFPKSGAPLVRLMIPAIGIDQELVEGKVDARTNTMVDPSGPFDIAYYTYSAHPGSGNSVFAGHLDYRNVGPAVFWNLRQLEQGDQVILRLSDGLELRYAVEFNRIHSAAEHEAWESLFRAAAASDAVTLYTCDGSFDTRTRSYSERRVVRAVRIA